MKIYRVGGAVRDKLLGLPIKEQDWVVVGATPKDMLDLGFRQVGKEFPVFLHPKTNEEYALARMERKVKPGYTGFTFDTSPAVTLEEDLIRRDLTINAMAEDERGHLIDPYHGKQDLDKKILRHVSPAFAEDPVRILRLGRFYARYAHLGFRVAPETITLMRAMVSAGEVDALVAERVWKELERALGEKNPEKFFDVLAECGALDKLFPDVATKETGIQALISAATLTHSAVERFAALLYDLPDTKNAISALCNRYRVPNEYRELALLTAQYYKEAFKMTACHNPQDQQSNAPALLTLLTALDIFRREERFKHFLAACAAIANANRMNFDQTVLLSVAEFTKEHSSRSIQALLAQGFTGKELAEKIKEERIKIIHDWINSRK